LLRDLTLQNQLINIFCEIKSFVSQTLPPGAHAARERGREHFKTSDWLSAAEAFTEV
jgi:hypothetical protein